MEYNVPSSNAYTKPHSEYSVLDDGYLRLIASPPQSLYPPMKFQNVSFSNVKLGYDSLTEGSSQTGYNVYNVAYPTACSQYNVVECPTNKVLFPLDKSPMPGHAKSGSPAPGAKAMLPAQVQEQYKRLGVKLFISADPNRPCPWCKKAIVLLQQLGLLQYTQVLNIQDAKVKQELVGLGGTGVPFFYSSSSGASVPNFVPDISSLIRRLSQRVASMAPLAGSGLPNGGTDFYLLTSDSCPHCRSFKQHLHSNNLAHFFNAVPTTDAAAMKPFADLKLTGVPAMVAKSRSNGQIKDVAVGMPDMQSFKQKVQQFLQKNM